MPPTALPRLSAAPLESRLAPASLASPAVMVNAETAGNQTIPSVTAFSQGFVTVFADDATNGGGVFGRILDAGGTPVGTGFQLAGAGAASPRVAGLTGGGFVAVWNQDNNVFAQMFRADTSAVAGPFRVNLETVPTLSPAVAGLSDGGFAVVWELDVGSQRAIYGRRFDDSGNSAGATFDVTSARPITGGNAVQPSVAGLAGGGFVVSYTNVPRRTSTVDPIFPSSVAYVRYDASGSRAGEGTVYADASGQSAAFAPSGNQSAVITLGDGGFVVAYYRTAFGGGLSSVAQPAGVFAQRYSAAGQVVTPTFQVSTDPRPVGPVRGAGLANGGFVVAYGSSGYDGSGTSALAQEFDASANRVGPEFVAHGVFAGDQGSPAVAASPDGRYFIAFDSQNLDGSGRGIGLSCFGRLVPSPTPTPSNPVRRFAYGSARGVASAVTVFDAQGALVAELQPFAGSASGTTAATADVNGDGTEDVVAGLGAGGQPLVAVYDGKTFQLLSIFYAFDPAFRGGVNVAAGDLDGDGRAEIVAGAGLGSVPVARVLDGQTGAEEGAFFAFDPAFRGGVSVAVADLTGDNRPDVAAGAGPGGVPVVAGFDGRSFAQVGAAFAFDVAFRGGVFVGAGDVTGDRRADVVVGAGPGGVPVVRVFDALTFADVNPFFAADQGFGGGLVVAVADPTNAGTGSVVVGYGAGSAQVAAYDATRTPPSRLPAPAAPGRQAVFGTLPPSLAQIGAIQAGDFDAAFNG